MLTAFHLRIKNHKVTLSSLVMNESLWRQYWSFGSSLPDAPMESEDAASSSNATVEALRADVEWLKRQNRALQSSNDRARTRVRTRTPPTGKGGGKGGKNQSASNSAAQGEGAAVRAVSATGNGGGRGRGGRRQRSRDANWA